MIYFKQGMIDIQRIDLTQLQKVRDFQKEIAGKGGLYFTFDTTEHFADSLRIHLSNLMNDLVSKRSVSMSQLAAIEEENLEDEDVGFYESLDANVERFGQTEEIVGRMTGYLTELTEKMDNRTKALNRLSGASNEVRNREMRRIVDLTADDYDDYTEKTRQELPIYHQAFYEAIQHLNNAISIYQEWLPEADDSTELRSTYLGLRSNIEATRQQIAGFKGSLQGIPGLTTKMIKAKKRILQTLDDVISELEFSITLINEFDDKFGKI